MFIGSLVYLSVLRVLHGSQISAVGIPFFNTTPFDLSIAVTGQEILGEALLGIQAANEPDFYVAHGHRASVCLLRLRMDHPSSHTPLLDVQSVRLLRRV